MLKIIHEDNHVLVVIKPQNVPSQEDSSKDKDMLTMVKEYLKEKYNKPGNVYAGLVHRLDRPTGGVMVFAKTSKAASRLAEQIKTGDFQKTYLAVVNGSPKVNYEQLTNYLAKNETLNKVQIVPQLVDGAKIAKMEYNLMQKSEKLSLLKIHLFTGRSHQIRVQLKGIGLPIYGDAKYGNGERGNLALWAYELKFLHPTTRVPMTFQVYPPTEERPWNEFNFTK